MIILSVLPSEFMQVSRTIRKIHLVQKSKPQYVGDVTQQDIASSYHAQICASHSLDFWSASRQVAEILEETWETWWSSSKTISISTNMFCLLRMLMCEEFVGFFFDMIMTNSA